MSLLIPYGVDPDETWEIDFARALAERTIRLSREVAKRVLENAAKEPDAKKKATLERAAKLSAEKVEALEVDLAKYEPGSGPVFIVGSIPNGKRGELAGEAYDVSRIEEGKTRGARDDAWAAEVVRWTVRGHRNLRRRDGAEIPFAAETMKWNGEDRQVPSRRTLEAYGPILSDLALTILDSQRLDEAGKNA
jgi:hypothetical protein